MRRSRTVSGDHPTRHPESAVAAGSVLDGLLPGRDPRHHRPQLGTDLLDRVRLALVLEAVLELSGVDELSVSPWALREGLILRFLDGLGR